LLRLELTNLEFLNHGEKNVMRQERAKGAGGGGGGGGGVGMRGGAEWGKAIYGENSACTKR